jgi:hypothetical protein
MLATELLFVYVYCLVDDAIKAGAYQNQLIAATLLVVAHATARASMVVNGTGGRMSAPRWPFKRCANW